MLFCASISIDVTPSHGWPHGMPFAVVQRVQVEPSHFASPPFTVWRSSSVTQRFPRLSHAKSLTMFVGQIGAFAVFQTVVTRVPSNIKSPTSLAIHAFPWASNLTFPRLWPGHFASTFV